MSFILSLLRRVDIPGLIATGVLVSVFCAVASPLVVDCTTADCAFLDLGAHWLWINLTVALWLVARTSGVTRKLSAIAALLAIGQLSTEYLNAAPTATAAQTTSASLRVIQANVHTANPDPQPFLAWMRKQKADIVVVQEVSPTWEKVLSQLQDYPYQKIHSSTGNFGIAILSKLPVDRIDLWTPERDTPFMDAHFKWGGTKVRLIAVHPMPPKDAYFSTRLKAKLGQLAKITAASSPGILIGDFNTTPWSAGGKAVTRAGLKFVAPLKPTWPTNLGLAAPLPLDQIAVSKHWEVVSHEVGPDIGSDHYPIVAVLQLTPVTSLSR